MKALYWHGERGVMASTDSNGPAPDPEPGNPPRPRRQWLNVAIGVAIIGAVGTLGVPIVTAYVDSAGKPPPPKTNESSPPARCDAADPIELTAPLEVGGTFETTTTVLCAPPKGTKYYFISQEDNVGEKGTEHTVYCPKEAIIPGAETKSYVFEREIQRSPIGTKKRLYYLRVDAAQEQELFTNVVDTCVWKLPDGTDHVSNDAEVRRGW
jgi:hypothetical protein